MTLNNFHTAMYLANLLYDTNFTNPDEFEEIALIAYSKIGNKNTRFYKYTTEIGDDLLVDLPCNCDIIEAVTYDSEDWNYTTGIHPNGDIHSSYVEEYIESRKEYLNPLYIKGKFAKFERVGNTLYFNKNYGRVTILYKGLVLDEEGLPIINDKEVDAISVFCAFTKKYKEGLSTNNPSLILLAADLKAEWLTQCSRAQVPEELTLNDLNEILDVKTQWMRKTHGRSYKPIIS